MQNPTKQIKRCKFRCKHNVSNKNPSCTFYYDPQKGENNMNY